jgi:L-alanine-DL-glutamate epimerase-like enolase superfamily enzyme
MADHRGDVHRAAEVVVERLDVDAYQVPTDQPEADGTIEWDSTTIVVVHAHGGGEIGLGYTYGSPAVAGLIRGKLAGLVEGRPLDGRSATWLTMTTALRNIGRPGVGMMAVSAVDVALWDLEARLLGLPVVDLLHPARREVPIYGSGGFCTYSLERIADQLGGWVAAGIPRVKMKVSRHPGEDPARVAAARRAIGDGAELYVDSNGAFRAKEALGWAWRFREEWQVSWYEEPVSSADFAGLRLLRERGPGGLDIAAGEYAFVPADFRNLVDAGAVDCLQADVTRCGGITGLLQVGGLAQAHGLDVSGHCAPAVSAHALCGLHHVRHLEYFHDHVRLEGMLFDGVPTLDGGCLRPDPSRPGLGLELKRADAERYRVA